jgi:hypothetical protein
MCALSLVRFVPNPHRKLIALCELAAASGGTLTTFAAAAKAIGVTPGRVTQLFGHGVEHAGSNVEAATLDKLAAAFTTDGVRCETDWLCLDYGEFAVRLAKANPAAAGPRRTALADAPAAAWERTEATALPGLVELRLHPPHAANEVPDSFYVDATLLFGTACADHLPEDGSEPRSVTIALRQALLAIGSESYAPLKDSMLGERGEVSPHYRRVAGGVEVTGPAPDGVLEGSPVADEHLAVVAGTHAGDEPFAVSVAANWGAFVVTEPAAPPGSNAPAGNRTAILNALIYASAAKDRLGRAVLARATMRRKEPAEPSS